MKKSIITIIFLTVIISACNKAHTKKTTPMEGGEKSTFVFTPEKLTINYKIDTLEVRANQWIDITYGNNYPLGHEGIEDNAILANFTQDTLTSEWLKAIALREGENIMKVITLSENRTGKDRSYCIHVGVGPSFGSLVVTQLAE